MAIKDLGPLDWRTPIVTPDGRPTTEFQRRWITQEENNSQIGGIIIGSGPPTGVPADGAQYADTSTTPYTLYIGSGGAWGKVGVSSANPTAIAKDTAINGSAETFMRSDAAPAIQKASASQFGIVKVDGSTITESGGVISAVGGGSGGYPAVVSGGTNTSTSSSTNASKGIRLGRGITPLTLSSVVPRVNWNNTFSYYCTVGVADSAGVIQSILGTTSSRTGLPTGISDQRFDFPTPVILDQSTLTSGQDFFALVTCSNGSGGASFVLPLFIISENNVSLSGTFWTNVRAVTLFSAAPSVGQTIASWVSGLNCFRVSFFGIEN